MKAPTHAPSSVSTVVYRWRFAVLPSPRTLGLLACRELDGALGLTETADGCLQETRGGDNVQHRLVGLLRQSVDSRLAGYEDANDGERLADDPTMRVVVGDRGIDRPAASVSTWAGSKPRYYERRQRGRVGPTELQVGGRSYVPHAAQAGALGRDSWMNRQGRDKKNFRTWENNWHATFPEPLLA